MIRPASLVNWNWATATWVWRDAAWKWRDPDPGFNVQIQVVADQLGATQLTHGSMRPASLVHWSWRSAAWTWRDATWTWRYVDQATLPTIPSISASATGGRSREASVQSETIQLAGQPTASMSFLSDVTVPAIEVSIDHLIQSALVVTEVETDLPLSADIASPKASFNSAIQSLITLSGSIGVPGAELVAAVAATVALEGQLAANEIKQINLPPTRKSLTVRRASWQ